MLAKQYLSRISNLNELIEEKMDKLFEYKLRCGILGANGNSERVQTSKKADNIVEIVALIVDTSNEIDMLIDKLTDLKIEVLDTLKKLNNPRQKSVLEQIYVYGLSQRAVSLELGLKYQTVRNVHSQGLKELQNILDIDKN